MIARAAGVARPVRLDPRIGLTYHLPDPEPAGCRDARMRVLRDGYVGVAPVAGGRVNIGIVLGRSWRPALARDGARAVADSIVRAIPPTADDTAAWRDGEPTRCDRGCLAARPSGDAPFRPGLAAGRGCGGIPRPVHGGGPASRAGLGRACRGRNRRGPPWARGRLRRVRPRDAAPIPRERRRVVARPGVPGPPAAVRLRRPTGRRPAAGSWDDGPRDGRPRPRSRALDPRFLASLLAP